MASNEVSADKQVGLVVYFEESPGVFKPMRLRADANGAALVSPRHLAGEENETAKYDSQLRVQADYKSTRITAPASDQTVYAGPCRIGSLINETAGAATVTIKDDTGTVMTVTVPANGVLDSIRGQRFAANLKVNTTAQPLVVQYREAKFQD